MKASITEDIRFASFIEVEEPQICSPTAVKVQVESVGICGTDIKVYEGYHSLSMGQKRIPGHEFAGIVTEIGGQVKGLKKGDHVVHEPISYCGQCYACLKGEGNVCAQAKVTGCSTPGGLEEYFVSDEQQWYGIPDWISWSETALVEPCTIAAQVCARAELVPEDTLLIYGAGLIGLMLVDTAMHMGAMVVISEISDGGLRMAREVGIPYVIDSTRDNLRERVMELTGGYGPNIIADCASIVQLDKETIDMLPPYGRLVPVVVMPFMSDGYRAMRKQLKIVASRLQMYQFAPVISNFRQYQEHVDRVIADVLDFRDTKKTFALTGQRRLETGKIALRLNKYMDQWRGRLWIRLW